MDELELKGSALAKFASDNGLLSGLSGQDIITLYLYENWKDGADWCVIEEMQETEKDPVECRQMLIEQYGYNL